MENETGMISQAEVSRLLGVTSERVRQLIFERKLDAIKVGKISLVKMASVNKLIEDRKKLKPDGRRKI